MQSTSTYPTAVNAPSNGSADRPDGFTFPAVHNFPPFFTLQRNAQTLAAQLAQWTRLILDYCQHYRIFVIDCDENNSFSLFKNQTIDRQLSLDAIQTIFKAMVEQGDAVWEPQLSTSSGKAATVQVGRSILVFWQKPEQWAEMIYAWITKTGQNRSIMTLFELTEGDLVRGEEFAELPAPLLRLALAVLEKQGKARVFEGTETGEGMTGVKFT